MRNCCPLREPGALKRNLSLSFMNWKLLRSLFFFCQLYCWAFGAYGFSSFFSSYRFFLSSSGLVKQPPISILTVCKSSDLGLQPSVVLLVEGFEDPGAVIPQLSEVVPLFPCNIANIESWTCDGWRRYLSGDWLHFLSVSYLKMSCFHVFYA